MTRTVLVTGATGFLGSHILEALQPLATEGKIELIAACRDRSRLIAGFSGSVREGDLRDEAYVKSLVQGVDTLCHAASWTSLWGKPKQSKTLFLEPSLHLIKAAKAAGVSRFINNSTTSAAAPDASTDANHPGIKRPLWPHLCNVIAIEDYLRAQASDEFQVFNLRLGIFAGARYNLGILPILLPRLKTHLVPWVAGGKTHLPIVDGRDLGQAFARAVEAPNQAHPFEGFNITGPSQPTLREVIQWISREYGYPTPHFSVPFFIAYPFAWLMEQLDRVVPWEPLVTRSIIHLIEETGVDNQKAWQQLGYQPEHSWQSAIARQLAEMQHRQLKPMRMYRPIA